MASAAGWTSRDQMAGGDTPADERIMPDEERAVPDAGATAGDNGAPVPDDQRIVPDDDPVVMDERLADDDRIVLGNDDNAAAGSGAGPAGQAAGSRSGLVAEPRPGAGSARVITDLPQDAVPASTSAVPPQGTGQAGSPGMAAGSPPGAGRGSASPSDRWPEIQAMFVDDPRASVERAVGLMDESVEALIASVRQRQQALLSAWQGTDAGTEELRNALQGYRTFWYQLDAFVQDA